MHEPRYKITSVYSLYTHIAPVRPSITSYLFNTYLKNEKVTYAAFSFKRHSASLSDVWGTEPQGTGSNVFIEWRSPKSWCNYEFDHFEIYFCFCFDLGINWIWHLIFLGKIFSNAGHITGFVQFFSSSMLGMLEIYDVSINFLTIQILLSIREQLESCRSVLDFGDAIGIYGVKVRNTIYMAILHNEG